MVKEGYLYHIKDEFFDLVKDSNLMTNHEKGRKRPTYFTIRDNDILWFIPLSSKVNKYDKIIKNKIKKYGYCNTIIIGEIMGTKHAILLQNAFPILEKYIDHVHCINGKPIKVIDSLQKEILTNFRSMLKMKEKGINMFFVDIDKIKEILFNELYIGN